MRGEYLKKTVHHNRDGSSGTTFFSFSLTQVCKVLEQFSQLYYINDGKNPSQASSFSPKRKNVAARGWATNFYGRAILFRWSLLQHIWQFSVRSCLIFFLLIIARPLSSLLLTPNSGNCFSSFAWISPQRLSRIQLRHTGDFILFEHFWVVLYWWRMGTFRLPLAYCSCDVG